MQLYRRYSQGEISEAACRVSGDVSAYFFFQAEDGIRDYKVTGVQTCALPILATAIRVMLCSSGRIGSTDLEKVSCTGPRTCPAFSPVDMTAPNARTSKNRLHKIGRASCRERV